MTNTLLQSLRERILDESEPLDGLLRKCLLLGAETGSTSLRAWARNELDGYKNDDQVPGYRVFPTSPIVTEEISGRFHSKGRRLHRLELPDNASEVIPEHFNVFQSVAELEGHSKSKEVSFLTPDLSLAKLLWNRELDSDFQQIVGLTYVLSGSSIAGILSKIRTQLVEIIADLTAEIPLAELPRKDQVDSAVSHHIGTQYNTTIHATNGPTAIGTEARATSNGLSLQDAITLLETAQATANAEVQDDSDKAEILKAIADLHAAATKRSPNTGEVVKKVGKLRKISEHVGIPALSAAVGGSTETLISMALSGAFG
ncbi:hypothetical protein FQ154_18740 [Paeniglutamicibacter gangotriensis]|uniref:AbiTii domain-containing protein n=1 Tax=Paeniglutamicibacter gangotriensis TaxID=254787 RepID=A0A5B0E6E3_9MICC|nr:hypothetical protein [Paeniglutamicibacter gangotriensis]KAA0973340.1 hypothetical protein FQ154_18740 [Paeniglutamicibacter gangotriensis]